MIVRRLIAALARMHRDRRGNVLMIVALSIIPLVCATGMGIDYSRAARMQTKLNAVADAAVLAAVSKPMMSQSTANAGAAIVNMWNAQTGAMAGMLTPNQHTLRTSNSSNVVDSDDGNIHIRVTDTPKSSGGVERVSTITYSVASTNSFASVLGLASLAIGGKATATSNTVTYLDYYILLDVSQSMGIGATPTDMQALFNRTQAYNGSGCVFGCHVAQGGSYANEYLAHSISPRINLRIDAAVSAIQTMIADAQDAAGQYKNIRIGIYTMNIDPTNGQTMTIVSAPSSDYASLKTKVAAITLGNNTSAGIGDTDYVTSGTQFYNAVPSNGTGLSQASPKNYTFLVADGLNDKQGSSCTSGHCTSVLDPSNCSYFKAKSTVGVIYTTYLPIYNNNNSSNGYNINYQQLVLPLQSQIAPAMQQCASDNTVYYEANDGAAIDASMKALFASTLKTARLSQ